MTSLDISIRPRGGWFAAGALAGLVLAVVIGPALAPRAVNAQAGSTTPPEHTISVAGTGTVTIAPDVADLRVGVAVTRPKVKDARQVAATQMAAVIAALKKAGIADADIQTTVLSLQPQYDYPVNGQPRLTGYQVMNQVTATIRNLDRIDDAVDGAMGAGATTMDGLTFRVDDPTKAEAQARDMAVKAARAKADALAKAAGISITGVASISDQNVALPNPVPYMTAGAAPDKAVSTPIQVGTNDVTVTVAVVYLID